MSVQMQIVDQLKVYICSTAYEMGKYAADNAIEQIEMMLRTEEEINIVFAAAPSQNEFLTALRESKRVDWSKINAFHMDEYVGLRIGERGSFTKFLNDAVFDVLPFKNVYRLNGAALDSVQECNRYADLLKDHPIHIVFMGVGENGHIAFNDPLVADFEDSVLVKTVELDDVCRMQQVHDKCFENLDSVPRFAYTLTIPALIAAKKLICVVPGKMKAAAIARMLTGSITEECPASILRRHNDAKLMLDMDSATIWKEEKEER